MAKKKDSSPKDSPPQPASGGIAESLMVTPRVTLHRFDRTVKELADLSTGDRIPCPDPADRELDLCVNERVVGRGTFVTDGEETYFELTWVGEAEGG
jgi:flagellar motor switch/type III secretory pathway protein FliN